MSVATAYRHLRTDAVRLLSQWRPPDARQERLRADYLTFLATHPDGVAKAGPPSHVTASALVFDATLECVLLTHHAKAGMWLQLGGHLEPEDRGLYAAAHREIREESGILGVRVQPRIAQLDRHTLGGAFGHCREHLDVRFAAVVPPGLEDSVVVSGESLDVAWWPLDALPEATAPEIGELAQACLDVLLTSTRRS